ncbi:MAG: glycosyl hydrolase [Candidatus Roizmanbacteria bacterium]|nr:glycosyl hydrolase [Candidatus Roizmanbacteria bacterium]
MYRKGMKGHTNNIVIGLGALTIFVLLVLIKTPFVKKLPYFQYSHREILIGVWTEEFWNNQTKTLEVQKIKEFEKNINKKVAIANYFRGWDEMGHPQVITELNSMHSNGWTPMVSTNPYFTEKCTSSTDDLYVTIAKGNCDVLIRSIAKVIKTYDKPIFLRFAWEMNIDSNTWSVQSTYSSPDAFIAAWRHMHAIFTAQKVKNVKWVFSVNVESPSTIPIELLYPGDAYVDWTGIDGYNYGTTQSWSHWSSFDEVFRPTYEHMLAIAPNKPLMISEFNSVAQGGSKSEWFADALDVQIPNHYPKIKAIIFFNENKTITEGVDWRIENSRSVINTVRKSLDNSIYTSK